MNEDFDDLVPSPASSRALWLLVGVFLLIGAIFANLWFFGVPLPQAPVPPPEVPLASARFDDGFEVRVLRAESKHEIRFDLPKPTGYWGRYSANPSSHGSGESGLMIYVHQNNGAFSGAGFEYQSAKADSLMLVLRGTEPDGRVFANSEFMAQHGRHFLRRKDGTFDKAENVSHPSDKPENMPLHLQVEDGAGGWLDLDGPLIIDEKEGRGFAGVRVFPRRKPDLKLRALRSGQTPVEMTIPNPGFKPAFPVLTPQSPPIVHRGADFTVTCKGLLWRKRGQRLALNLNIQLDHPSLPPGSLQAQYVLFDATGNQILDPFYDFGVPLPGEKVCRVLHSLQRGAPSYPWPENEAVIVATGILAPPGTPQTAELTTKARTLGFNEITFHPPAVMPIPVPLLLAFRLHGETTLTGVKALREDYEPNVAVFAAQGAAIGETRPASSGTTHSVGKTRFHQDHTWGGPLKPGETFRIGMVKSQKPQELEFILAIPPPP